MGEAKIRNSTAPLDASRDRALATKGDLTSVQVWCDQVRADVIELCEDAEVKYMQQFRTELADAERLLREEIQTVRSALDEYRRDDLLYRNNVSVRGRLRRLKWWLLAVLPFGIGACINGGERVGGSSLRAYADSARHVVCYGLSDGAHSIVPALSCVRIDSLTVWRMRDSTWVSR